MSISDLIIVMKKGVVQQIGAPQDVYDDPANLFVAKFLGTPAINVFKGEVRGGQLFIGGSAVLDVPGVRDGGVWTGIRPEGFIPDSNGPFESDLLGIEVMGRDITVLSGHPDAENPVVRSIISSDRRIDTSSPTVRFRLKPYKVFLFDDATEERIKFEYDADAAEEAEAGGAV